MKKIGIVFLLFFCFYCANARQPVDSSLSKYSIGILGSIDYYIYDYNHSEGTGLDDHYYKSRNTHYSKGVLLKYRVYKKLNIVTGIVCGEKGFSRITNPLYITVELRYRKLEYYAYYGEIPLLLQYSSNRSEGLSGIISGGFIASIPLRESAQYISIDGAQYNKTINAWQWERSDDGKDNFPFLDLSANKKWKIHGSIAVAPGIAYCVKKFEFSFQAMYKFYFVNIYDIRLNKKASSLSTMFNIFYHF